PEEALTTAQEAVQIKRRLAAENPAAHEPNFAASLSVLASTLATTGELFAALSATGEAVELYRRHLGTLTSVLRLHAVLDLQAQLLERVGRQQESETVRRWLEKNPPPPGLHR
ncbi:hypothetical protein ACIRQ9_35685, partial [Streptomyces sp. NPDC101237]